MRCIKVGRLIGRKPLFSSHDYPILDESISISIFHVIVASTFVHRLDPIYHTSPFPSEHSRKFPLDRSKGRRIEDRFQPIQHDEYMDRRSRAVFPRQEGQGSAGEDHRLEGDGALRSTERGTIDTPGNV